MRVARLSACSRCTRRVSAPPRADYCGDGIPNTENGTAIDMFDVYGFNVNENIAGFSDESGFDTSGAHWVTHKRWSSGEPEGGPWNTFESCQLPHFDPGRAQPGVSADLRVERGELLRELARHRLGNSVRTARNISPRGRASWAFLLWERCVISPWVPFPSSRSLVPP